jgi:hypothetical protein
MGLPSRNGDALRMVEEAGRLVEELRSSAGQRVEALVSAAANSLQVKLWQQIAMVILDVHRGLGTRGRANCMGADLELEEVDMVRENLENDSSRKEESRAAGRLDKGDGPKR